MSRRSTSMRAGVLALVGALSFIAPRAARAQANTAERLASAVRLYEDLQVERAVVLLRQVISPSSPYEVSREQRVQAYKYLGAALSLLGQRDSAVVYLRAAVERDPFVDMDAQSFSPGERAALAAARAQTFAVAARPVAAMSVDPRTERLTFTTLSTHAAELHVEIRPAGNGATGTATLLQGESDGVREIPWSGLVADGRLAPPGRYELLVRGRSRVTAHLDSARVWLDVRHERPTLEDTLPSLGPADLLPERHSPSVARKDLLRGVGVAVAALVTQSLVSDGRLGSNGSYAGGVALAGTGAGVAAYLMRQRNRDIPANVVANRQRVAERARVNLEIAERNRVRLAETRLVVAPAAGAAP